MLKGGVDTVDEELDVALVSPAAVKLSIEAANGIQFLS